MASEEDRRIVEVRETVVLTEKEERIFGRLRDVVRHFQLGTQLRVAGGWVRDKLLGKDSADIDIVLDNMTGQNFCEKVNEYSELMGEEQKGIGVIQCNPDQSKHLETARMLIFDIWIDFVNLRSEKYAENSRIPTVEIGTAKEDAYRRDLTINSLFFNINNNSVEDLTGRGIEDLKKGLIVTPLHAKATFLDDPLRVLRAIRFAARFNFTLAEDLKDAASDEKVKSELGSKISRERIGHEIDLMMSDKHPVKAMCHICDLGLFYVVFTFPEKSEPPIFDKCDQCCVSYIEAAWNLEYSSGDSVFTGHLDAKLQDEQRRLCLYSALFVPLRDMFYLDKKSKKLLDSTLHWLKI
jgi:tRNA nucleotidyltransferase/poly(A) polymerase